MDKIAITGAVIAVIVVLYLALGGTQQALVIQDIYTGEIYQECRVPAGTSLPVTCATSASGNTGYILLESEIGSVKGYIPSEITANNVQKVECKYTNGKTTFGVITNILNRQYPPSSGHPAGLALACPYSGSVAGSVDIVYVPPASECTVASDCEGKAHIQCVGSWSCEDGSCVWNCDSIPEPTPDPEVSIVTRIANFFRGIWAWILGLFGM